MQATLLQVTARSVAGAIGSQLDAAAVDQVFVCGGGGWNLALMRTLEKQLSHIPVARTDALGLPPPGWVEAAALAWLARQTLEGKPGNLPSVTGARHPVVLGGVYRA